MKDLVNGLKEKIGFTVAHSYDFREVFHPGRGKRTPVAREMVGCKRGNSVDDMSKGGVVECHRGTF